MTEATTPSPRLRIAWRVMELLSYLALALALTWPLPRHFTTHIPQGSEPAATVRVARTIAPTQGIFGQPTPKGMA